MSFSRRSLRISYIAHSSISSVTRVRGDPCFEELRTYRRVTSVAPSIENAMQYESLRFHPSRTLVGIIQYVSWK